MARITVRIELYDASSEDYQKLHEKMDKQGFTGTIKLKNGAWVMPPVEYNYDGQATKQQALEKAISAVASARQDFSQKLK